MAFKKYHNKAKIILIVIAAGTMVWSISAFKFSNNSRRFTITQTFTADIPAGAPEYKVWIPLPSDSEIQKVSNISIDSPVPYKETQDSDFGNKILFFEGNSSGATSLTWVIKYTINRSEQNGLSQTNKKPAALTEHQKNLYLQPRGLIKINDAVEKFAMKATKGKTGTINKAKGVYEFVFGHMSYDKSGEGWGRGDVAYACDIAKGNCTDFHSLFIAMMRSVHIPARFKMGFPVTNDDEGKLTGYHCWAEFYDETRGWIPVDISEAWKNPKKKKYFFGRLDENRFAISTGRHTNLNPQQRGPAFNWLLLPYAEVNETPLSNTSTQFEFKSLKGA